MVTRLQVRAWSQLPLLIRNAARPWHPIIGIALLASPVIRTRPRDKWIGWTFETFVQKLSIGDWNAKSALKAMALRTEIHAAAQRRTIREFGQGQGCFPKGGARTGDYAAPASDRPVSFFLLMRFLLFPERVRFGLCCGTCVVTFSQRGRDILISARCWKR